ncbi:hypothetical protein [Fimbriiglobus ruber]|uniref:Glycosyltransferase RgtA/B/C/D-like domain-containing protein n=1 Tax=Fimbriiglobus ruber TaxID=1908690 RepID=A0A225DVR2_9BACT|nr:hypothetical protein [Fimbriiglobus ruber]OWK40395.1 hypothetical protein FRUB_05314 [Fimbriiglobus ruber]
MQLPPAPVVRPIPIALLVAAAALPAAFTLAPALDHDTWWHIKVGELVCTSGTVPSTDPFSRLGREQPTPWVAYSWLYDIGIYQVYAHFGAAGILWVRAALGALSTAAVLGLAVRRGVTTTALIAAGMAAVTLMPLMRERPWHFSIAFTAVTAAVAQDLRGGGSVRRAMWLPLLFALWANLHIQFQ